jgi:ABC-type nickel/cobalt efflux system permease component RcnA
MKYTTVLFSLVAVTTAASIPNTNIPNTVTRGEGHHHDGHTEHDTHTAVARDEFHGQDNHHHENDAYGDYHVEKRSPRRSRFRHKSNSRYRNDASGVMKLNVAFLVAGLGAGVGAVFL